MPNPYPVMYSTRHYYLHSFSMLLMGAVMALNVYARNWWLLSLCVVLAVYILKINKPKKLPKLLPPAKPSKGSL